MRVPMLTDGPRRGRCRSVPVGYNIQSYGIYFLRHSLLPFFCFSVPVRHGVVWGTVRQFRAVVQPFRFFVQAVGVTLRRPWYGCASAATRACHGRDTICTAAAVQLAWACKNGMNVAYCRVNII